MSGIQKVLSFNILDKNFFRAKAATAFSAS